LWRRYALLRQLLSFFRYLNKRDFLFLKLENAPCVYVGDFGGVECFDNGVVETGVDVGEVEALETRVLVDLPDKVCSAHPCEVSGIGGQKEVLPSILRKVAEAHFTDEVEAP